MSRLTIIAVTDAATAKTILEQGFDLVNGKVQAIEAFGLSLLVAAKPKKSLISGLKRKQALNYIVEIQRLLEAFMTFGPVLAAVRGASLRDETEGLGLLASSHRTLRETLSGYGHKWQYQIVVRWQPREVLRAHAHLPEIAEAGSDNALGRRGLGKAIQQAMETLRREKAMHFRKQLAAVTDDIVDEALDGPDMVGNFTVLIAPDQAAALDAVVEAIDASMPDQLLIKFIGPYPPASFAGVALERFSKSDIRSAGSLLGVEPFGRADELRTAYLKYMKRHHPDVASLAGHQCDDAADHSDRAARAYRMLKALTEIQGNQIIADRNGAVVAHVERADEARSAA